MLEHSALVYHCTPCIKLKVIYINSTLQDTFSDLILLPSFKSSRRLAAKLVSR